MSAINIAVDMPQQPTFDLEKFKHRVQEYANILYVVMSNTTTAKSKSTADKAEALSFIQSLAVTGGEDIPVDENPIDCLISNKYCCQ